MFEEFAAKVHAKIPKPKTLDVGAGEEMISRILSAQPGELDWDDFASILDADASFEQRLYYLPHAFEYMASMRKWYDESYVSYALIFINCYASKIEGLGLLHDTMAALKAVFHVWLDFFRTLTDTFVAEIPDRLRFGAYVADGDIRDDYLDDIFDKTNLIWNKTEPLGPQMLLEWSRCSGKPTWSGHFLDMCARSQGGDPIGGRDNLYKSELLGKIVSDRELLNRHRSAAEECWREAQAATWYVKQIETLLKLP